MLAFDMYRCDCEPFKPELYENQKHVIMRESKTEKKKQKQLELVLGSCCGDDRACPLTKLCYYFTLKEQKLSRIEI